MTTFPRFPRIRLGRLAAALLAIAAILPGPTRAADGAAAVAVPRLLGTLDEPAAWQGYKARFVTAAGRVVDTGNDGISHSEGQGYALLLAVAADDRAAFERIWGWTRANLMVRDDALLAWRWEPGRRPAIADTNNATDGDILVAWALVEAAEAWSDPSYRVAARRSAVEIGRRLLVRSPQGSIVLPGLVGFADGQREDGPVINLSYWVFPAFARLGVAAPEFDWDELSRHGLRLLERARFGTQKLPTEWMSVRDRQAPVPARGFPPEFSYNALRIPLYLAWAARGDGESYRPFAALWSDADRQGLRLVDTETGRIVEQLRERGYAAVAALTACAADGTPWPRSLRNPLLTDNYYPVTLHLLALTAAKTRFSSCLRD